MKTEEVRNMFEMSASNPSDITVDKLDYQYVDRCGNVKVCAFNVMPVNLSKFKT